MPLIRLNDKQETLLLPEAILDVGQGRLLTGRAVLVRQGRIASLPEASDLQALAEVSGVETVLLPGITLLPGLIDCHVHFALDGIDFRQALQRWDQPAELERYLCRRAAEFLDAGVVAVRDGSDGAEIGWTTKKRIEAGDFPGPLVTATGFAIRRQGLYGTFLGPGIREITEGRQQIRQLAARGLDQIKIVVSGIVSFQEFGQVGPPHFDVPELTQLVEEAHGLGLKVMAHASSDLAVRTAALAGVDSVEHGYFLSQETLSIMAAKQVAWIPTLIPLAALQEGAWRQTRTLQEIAVLSKTVSLHQEMIGHAMLLGVTLGAGTDAGAIGVPAGTSLVREMELLREAGLSPGDCLRAATCQAAEVIGRPELGIIAPGMDCRLVGVSGNPLEDLAVLRDPVCLVLPD